MFFEQMQGGGEPRDGGAPPHQEKSDANGSQNQVGGGSPKSRNRMASRTQSMAGSASMNSSQPRPKGAVGSSVAQSSGGVMDSFSGVNVDEALPDGIHGGEASASPHVSPQQASPSPLLSYFDIHPALMAPQDAAAAPQTEYVPRKLDGAGLLQGQ